jgi:hypothetical protein
MTSALLQQRPPLRASFNNTAPILQISLENACADDTYQYLSVFKLGGDYIPCFADKYGSRGGQSHYNEVALCKNYRHPSVQDVYGIALMNSDDYVISELGHTTLDILLSSIERLPVRTVVLFTRMLFRGLFFLHKYSPTKFHGRISPFNVIYYPGGVKIKRFSGQRKTNFASPGYSVGGLNPLVSRYKDSKHTSESEMIENERRSDVYLLCLISKYMCGICDVHGNDVDDWLIQYVFSDSAYATFLGAIRNCMQMKNLKEIEDLSETLC